MISPGGTRGCRITAHLIAINLNIGRGRIHITLPVNDGVDLPTVVGDRIDDAGGQ